MKKITLLGPADGSVTEPLQKHVWPPEEGEIQGEEESDADAFDWRALQILTPDRSVPRPVTFTWERPAVGLGPISYTVLVSRFRDLSDPETIGPVARGKAEAWHLYLGTRYHWKVKAVRFGRTVAESPVWHFTTNSTPPRWIKVPGITNIRDIGGWPLPGNRLIRQGLIYRSSEMNGSLQISARGKRVLENELGIHTDLDLRGVGEASPALDPEKVKWIHLPISPYDSIRDEAFRDVYRRIFEVFSDASRYPIIFHCVGGADRGGTVAFLLNALLGKDKEHLFRDYELTSLSIWGERSRLSEQFNALLAALASFGPKGGTINEQVERYVKSIGVEADAVRAIRSQLTQERERE